MNIYENHSLIKEKVLFVKTQQNLLPIPGKFSLSAGHLNRKH